MNLVPQFGFFELVVVAVIALVVVGPKDLPKLMRLAGKAVAQARRLASEFTSAFDQMAREAEMEDMRKEIEALKRADPLKEAKDAIEEAARPVEKTLRDEADGLRGAVNRYSGPADDADPDAPEPVKAGRAE